MKILFLIPVILVFISGCLSDATKSDLKKDFKSGNIDINYYSDKTVSSLEVPPDLTSPNYQNAFRMKEYVEDIPENLISFSEKDRNNNQKKILDISSDISVKKEGNLRYLIVNKSPDLVWDLAKDFLILEGFVIEKSEKKIGIMETNYLENRPELPSESVGLIRSMFQKTLAARYTLPVIDKYRIRIEPEKNYSGSRVFLTHSSMREVYINSGTDSESTMWESSEKNFELEAEMLYRLMVYLGGDHVQSREKILNASSDEAINVSVEDYKDGYSKLVFNQNFIKTWDIFNWALDKLLIDIEDKDIIEKTIHVKGVEISKTGMLSKLFGDEALKETYRFIVKPIKENRTEILYFDLSEKNTASSKNYSTDLFNKIQKLLN